jgi:hypothetical protein
MGPISKKMVAECAGLWLAEGWNKSNSEITFTNNSFPLVKLFKVVMNGLFKKEGYNQRIYIYSKNGDRIDLPFKDCVIKYYVHKRATKPYFIYRIASVVLIKKWKDIVQRMLAKEMLYPHILRGFFAGEGNIHGGKRGVRVLRISQKERKEFIDNLLNRLKITFSFDASHRNYIISNKSNWDIFAKQKIADLHPIKKEKFWRFYKSYKEEHYPINYLRESLLLLLQKKYTAKQLSKKMSRSQARVSETLVELKKDNKINNFRVGSACYWTAEKDVLIISKKKDKYLSFLDKSKKTYEFANHFNVDWKSSFRRLNELKKLGLVEINKNQEWVKISGDKKIWVI